MRRKLLFTMTLVLVGCIATDAQIAVYDPANTAREQRHGGIEGVPGQPSTYTASATGSDGPALERVYQSGQVRAHGHPAMADPRLL